MMRYVFPCFVVKVEERTQIKRSHKNAQGEAEIEYEVIGYFAVLSRGNLAIYLGLDPPELKAGDGVRLILEKEV